MARQGLGLVLTGLLYQHQLAMLMLWDPQTEPALSGSESPHKAQNLAAGEWEP